jgi:DivIVA domain-containing protein
MADVHRRAAATSSRLTPEEITNRGFASAFRGISETEVRNFLRRVADEITAGREREAELTRQVEDLKDQLANPSPVTEQQLLNSLGEETARVLRSAQEAAEEIRKRAEEKAGALVKEAQDESSRLRQEAQQHSTSRREQAERKAAEVEQQAEAKATQLREDAAREAEALRESVTSETDALREQATATVDEEIANAKTSGRELVEEARTVRERVLADLGRRRSLLQAQVDELRSGRDRLLDAYRVVKRTLSDATDALAQVEARANAELAAPPPRVVVPPVAGELEAIEGGPAAAVSAAASESDAATEIDLEAESVVVIDEEPPAAGPPGGSGSEPPDAEDSGAAVDALFARLRASHTVDAPAAAAAAVAAPEAPANGSEAPAEAPAPATDAAVEESVDEESVDEESAPEDGPDAPTGESAPGADAAPESAPVAAASDGGDATEPWVEPLSPDDALRAARNAVLTPLAKDLTRRAKRALQDQQNELLDQIRTIRGKVESGAVLPDAGEQEAAWEPVLDEPLSAAYASAYAAMGNGEAPSSPQVPRELLAELAQVMVEPWRHRLVAAIDGSDDSDAITERLGARFREYRGQELELALGDALATAWAQGQFAAVPEGTLLRWVPDEVGRCPDCDDNALEPTARGAEFPTGQVAPPAHPGCRCFLALIEPAAATK